ncbi:hypothetical protein JL720_886 [Aureococcus anophagefferens]|nr:hypothetical protein JL720_886 [Aureococcus anophagefferens]
MPQAWSPFYACRVRDLVGEAARFSPNEGRFVSLQSAEDFESVGSASWLFAGADKSRFRNQSVQTEFRSLLRDGGWHLSHSHWGDAILGGGACASDAQLREDATLGRTLHEVEFRCRDRARTKGNVGVGWASLDRWHLAYAGTSRVPAGLGPFHRADPPKRAHRGQEKGDSTSLQRAHVEIHLDGFVQAYWLEAAAFHDEASGRFDDFAYREAARRAALGDLTFDCATRMRKRFADSARRLFGGGFSRSCGPVADDAALASRRGAAAARRRRPRRPPRTPSRPGRGAAARGAAAAARRRPWPTRAPRPSTPPPRGGRLEEPSELRNVVSGAVERFAPAPASPVLPQAVAACRRFLGGDVEDCGARLAENALARYAAQGRGDRGPARLFAALATRPRTAGGGATALGAAAAALAAARRPAPAPGARVALAALAFADRHDVVLKARRGRDVDAAFFATRGGGARADADAALAILRWVDGGGFSAGHVTVAVLWPAAYALPGALGAWRACVAAAGGEELLGRDVAWTAQGARVLAEHCYGDAPWLDYKVASCFPGPSRVARVSASRFPARAWADEAKAAFRTWYEARPAFAGDAKAAVHVADGAHSADLANLGAPAVARDLAARLAASLRGAAEGAAPPPVGAADAGGAARGRVVVDSRARRGLGPPAAAGAGRGGRRRRRRRLGAGEPTDAGAGPFAAPLSARLGDHGQDSPWFDRYFVADAATLVHDPLAHARLYGLKIAAVPVLTSQYERRAGAALPGSKDSWKAAADLDALREFAERHPGGWPTGPAALGTYTDTCDAVLARPWAEITTERRELPEDQDGARYW